MPKRQIFYSFHFDIDVMRVQQIRNIGAIEGNTPVHKNDWEAIKKNGDAAIKKWIDDNMDNRSCVVVLVGEETVNRPYVKYEIERAWAEKKGLLGIYINNIKCPNNGIGKLGKNPFDEFVFKDTTTKLSSKVKCYTPIPSDAYNDIKTNIGAWIEDAIANKRQ